MEKKKQNKVFSVILGVVLIAAAIFAAFKLINQVKPEVTIDGQQLTVGMTVQELTDAGFSVGISFTGSGDLDLDAEPQIPGEKYTSTSYYIFKDGEYTNVTFGVYNKNVNSCDFKDSRIYAFSFEAYHSLSDAEVLVNGIDVDGMAKEEAIHAFEELGVQFDDSDKEEFLNTDYGFIIGKSGNYSYELETDDANEVIESVRARQKV